MGLYSVQSHTMATINPPELIAGPLITIDDLGGAALCIPDSERSLLVSGHIALLLTCCANHLGLF